MLQPEKSKCLRHSFPLHIVHCTMHFLMSCYHYLAPVKHLNWLMTLANEQVHEHQHLLLAASFIQFMLSIFKCYVWTFPACSASHIVLRCLHGLLLVLWWTTDILLITLLSSWLSATVLGTPVVQLHSCNRFPAFQACTWRQYFWEAVYCPKFDFKNLFYLMYKPLPQSHLLLEKRLNFAFGYLDVS